MSFSRIQIRLAVLPGLRFAAGILLACVGMLPLRQTAFAQEDAGARSLKWRVAEPWLDPAKGRGYWTHNDDGLLTWDSMQHVGPDTALGQYLEQVRRWGFNAVSLPARMDVDGHAAAVQSLCSYLKGKGLGMFIHRDWNETELGSGFKLAKDTDARPRASALLSPYVAAVRGYWAKRIARDYELIPDLAGYRMDGGEYNHINGAPWMGEGPEIHGKTGAECVRDALRLVAGELGPRGGTLFWRDCEDDPWGMRDEVWYFQGMTGEIPANAFILIKDCYWDYQPGWPSHPLNRLITRDARGHSPYLTTIQLPGEYTGTSDFPWCRVEHIAETMKTAVATGQQGFWVAALPLAKAPWDHPLNLVNWYAVSAAMKNPSADPEEMKAAWAKSEYGDAAGPVLEIVRKVTAAAEGMYEFDGLVTECHSRFPTLEYLDCHLCGPLRQTRRMKGMMGLTFPLDMYSPEVAAQIRADPKTRLAFNQVPITEELKAQAMAEKDGAVRLIREALDLAQTLRGKIADSRSAEILSGLRGNLTDALVFRQMMELYMDWKLGTLTETEIDADLAACAGLLGCVVPQPLDPHPPKVTNAGPASFKTFAEELRRELRRPWVEEYWRDHPDGIMADPTLHPPTPAK